MFCPRRSIRSRRRRGTQAAMPMHHEYRFSQPYSLVEACGILTILGVWGSQCLQGLVLYFKV